MTVRSAVRIASRAPSSGVGRRRAGVRGDDGVAVVEFVMISALLVFLLFGVLQVAAVLYVRSVVAASAADGARYAAAAGIGAGAGGARADQLMAQAVSGSLSSDIPCTGREVVDPGVRTARGAGRVHRPDPLDLPAGRAVRQHPRALAGVAGDAMTTCRWIDPLPDGSPRVADVEQPRGHRQRQCRRRVRVRGPDRDGSLDLPHRAVLDRSSVTSSRSPRPRARPAGRSPPPTRPAQGHDPGSGRGPDGLRRRGSGPPGAAAVRRRGRRLRLDPDRADAAGRAPSSPSASWTTTSCRPCR